jgi:lactoylglutathione lyase
MQTVGLVNRNETLHTAYRVSDVQRSVGFYRTIGFREIGRVSVGDGSTLLMLNLPDDAEVVTLELVHNPALGGVDVGNGFSHIVVQVENLEAIMSTLRSSGVECGPIEHPARRSVTFATRMATAWSSSSGHLDIRRA